MNTIHLLSTLGSPFLSSRASAAELRNSLIATAPVILDFSGIASVSDSFADECIAVLVEAYGYEWFANNIKVQGISAIDRETILRAVALRCEPLAA